MLKNKTRLKFKNVKIAIPNEPKMAIFCNSTKPSITAQPQNLLDSNPIKKMTRQAMDNAKRKSIDHSVIIGRNFFPRPMTNKTTATIVEISKYNGITTKPKIGLKSRLPNCVLTEANINARIKYKSALS